MMSFFRTAVCGAALLVPSAGLGDAANADMLVRDCLSREGAKESDSGPTGGVNTKRKCIFVYAAECAKAEDAQATMRCYDDETKAWDKLLNEAYARLRALSSSKLFSAVQAHQRSWPAYRDAMCGRFHETEEGVTGMSRSAERACLAKETALRAIALQDTADDVSRTTESR